jgi:hypothetical protein
MVQCAIKKNHFFVDIQEKYLYFTVRKNNENSYALKVAIVWIIEV